MAEKTEKAETTIEQQKPLNFRFEIGLTQLPHPEKEYKGGEDGYFATNYAIGVADGVGSYARKGMDPGKFAKNIMDECEKYLEEHPDLEELKKAVDHSLKMVQRRNIMGGTTVCLAVLHEDKLIGFNLGDSRFVIIRNGKLAYETKEGQHVFNCPHQITHKKRMREEEATQEDICVQDNDIILMGTDGLFDNVFKETIVKIMNDELQHEKSLDAIAQRLATEARKNSANRNFDSPFAQNARNSGVDKIGGKMDDITIVIARVVTEKETIDSLPPPPLPLSSSIEPNKQIEPMKQVDLNTQVEPSKQVVEETTVPPLDSSVSSS